MRMVKKSAPATCRNKSVLHRPPVNSAMATGNPMTLVCTASEGVVPVMMKINQETHQATSMAAVAPANTPILLHQIRRRATGWTSIKGNVASPSSRPKVLSASRATAKVKGHRVSAPGVQPSRGSSQIGITASPSAATNAGRTSRISFTISAFIF